MARSPYLPLAWLAVAALVVSSGCAQGSTGGGTDRNGDPDSSTGDDGGDTDASGPSDGGGGMDGGMGCADDDFPDSCPDAMDLGAVATGDMVMQEGKLPSSGDRDWFAVQFPPGFVDGGMPDGGTPDGGMPGGGMEGGGEPRIEVLPEGGDFLIEIRQRCAAAMLCTGEGPERATDLQAWSFTDDATAPDGGPSAYATREAEWPSDLFVKVYRAAGSSGDCMSYTLQISR